MFTIRFSSWSDLLLEADRTTREEFLVETNGHLVRGYMRLGGGMLIIVLV